MNQMLPLLPPGPGGVHILSLREDQVSNAYNTKYIKKIQARDVKLCAIMIN
ncbi:MAG: hypothetical protein Kow0076_8120 [Francisella sp.]